MNKLLFLIIVLAAGSVCAALDGSADLAKSLALIAGVLLAILAFLALLRAALEDAGTPKPRPNPGRDHGPDIIVYPDPPETFPQLRGPGPERFAPRGEMREVEAVRRLPPMRREQDPIQVEVPDWWKVTKERK